ncbi:uncharacterized protein LOC142358146 [Convolutriloba macropyga]|uniref:uncharacterized protein LOC142358146 n=1 Tax=Convolutriloba macropyga TaxID=536237 RepID=UPI003F524E6A
MLMTLAESDEGRMMVAQAGAIPLLVALLEEPTEGEALVVAGCLATLAVHSVSNQEDIILSGGLRNIVGLIHCPWPAAAECALALLANLSASSGNRQKIIRTGILPHLAGLLVGATDNLGSAQEQEQPEDWEMSSSMDPQVVDADPPGRQWPPHLTLPHSAQRHTLVGNIIAVLHNLVVDNGPAMIEIVTAGIAPPLVQVLVAGNEYDQAYALALLRLLLSLPMEDLHVYLASLGLMPALLRLTESETSPEVAQAARAAIAELSPSEATTVAIANAGNVPLMTWELPEALQDMDQDQETDQEEG